MTNRKPARERMGPAGRLGLTSTIGSLGNLTARLIDAQLGAQMTTPRHEEALRGDQR